LRKSHNKAFKRDSQRLAVLVQSSASMFMAQWFRSGGLRCSPLNAALCDKAKFLGFFKFNLFGQPFFGLGKSAFSAQII